MIKKLIVILSIALIISIPVSAESNSQEIYKEQYSISGLDDAKESLPKQTREFLENNGLDPENIDWVDNLNAENVFTHIFSFLKSGAKTPFVICLSIIAIIIVSSAIYSNSISPSVSEACYYATTLSASAVILVPLFNVITASINAMKGTSVFMGAFVPVFAVVIATSGAPVTASSMSALLLLAVQIVNYISNFAVMPLMSGYLGVSISSNVSPLVEKSGIADGIKKIAFWIMSLISTIFIGILSIQTAVNASADTLTVKTAKFIIGSAVPVAGTALSESLSTVTASMGLLKSSIGVYGVVACAVMFLPLLTELFLWRIALLITSSVSDLFSVGKISSLLKSVDSVLSLLIGIILLTLAMFVISLAVVISTGGTA